MGFRKEKITNAYIDRIKDTYNIMTLSLALEMYSERLEYSQLL